MVTLLKRLAKFCRSCNTFRRKLNIAFNSFNKWVDRQCSLVQYIMAIIVVEILGLSLLLVVKGIFG